MQFTTYPPHLFQDLIERIWLLDNDETASTVYFPPEPYVNVIIPLLDCNYLSAGRLIARPSKEAICLHHKRIVYPAHAKLIGIRFYAYGGYPFFLDPSSPDDTHLMALQLLKEDLDDLLRQSLSALEENIVSCVEQWLQSRYAADLAVRIKPVQDFYKKFRWAEKVDQVSSFCQEQGMNYTSLNRLFTEVVGLSPKKFDRLIKFRRSLCSLIDSQQDLTSIGHLAGYFDQAHFIREFKLFSNVSPSAYQKLMTTEDLLQYNFRLL